LLWYFAITEAITLSNPGLYKFAELIKEGRLTEFMQRPTGVITLVLARLSGMQVSQAIVLTLALMATLPWLTGCSIPLDPPRAFLPVVSMTLGIAILQFLGYAVSTIEVWGPYGRAASWIVGKFIFVFGGLFFPVCFFPPVVQSIAFLTPF